MLAARYPLRRRMQTEIPTPPARLPSRPPILYPLANGVTKGCP